MLLVGRQDLAITFFYHTDIICICKYKELICVAILLYLALRKRDTKIDILEGDLSLMVEKDDFVVPRRG